MGSIMPVGKAQQVILNALGLTAISWGGAEAHFERLGIIVIAKRQGRSSVPVVRLKKDAGGWSVGGDGESGGPLHSLTPEQLAALKPWIES